MIGNQHSAARLAAILEEDDAPTAADKSQRKADRENIAEAIRILFEPGQVVELRVPKAGKLGTISGYFDDHTKLEARLCFGTAGMRLLIFPPSACRSRLTTAKRSRRSV
jgi:hypothetical protein